MRHRPEDAKKWGGIMCLEGDYEESLEDRSSMLPILDLLERVSRDGITYIHRDVGTRAELDYYLRKWIERNDYYTLYLSFHGTADGIQMSEHDDGTATLEHLADILADAINDCVVHFGSCSVLAAEDQRLQHFLARTGARAVMGYAKDVDWLDSAALDMVVLATLGRYKQLGTGLRQLEEAPRYASLRKELGFRIVQSKAARR